MQPERPAPDAPAAGRWRQAWAEARFRALSLAAVPVLVLGLWAFGAFVQWVERRPGVVLEDPVLRVVPARDVTWLTFGLIYAGLLLALACLAVRPRRLLVAVWGYVLLLGMRAAMMWVTPLEPPPGIIELRDPLVELSGGGHALTRDLFFSGHTATLFLLFLAVEQRRPRRLLLLATVAVGGATLWQHVHYTIDVLAAPVVAWACYGLARGATGPGPAAPQRSA